MKKEKRTALITGASSGIGWAIAKEIASEYKLILCGRRKSKLELLRNELQSITEVHLLTFDVRDSNAVKTSICSIPKEFSSVQVLINNAGNAHGLAPIDKGELKDFDTMIDGNVQGLLYVTHALLPHLKETENATIVNISSIAGKETYANGTVYCASKSAVEALSRGMRLDLLPYNIRVCNLAPGAVETEFSEVRFKGNKTLAKKVYHGFEPLVAEDIARSVGFVLQQPPHVQISDITILPTAQAGATSIRKD